MTYSAHYDEQIGFLSRFFDTAENSSLLYLSSDNLRQMRTRIRSALNDLLVWGRPHLLSERGLQWPYHECNRVAADFEKVYRQGTDNSAQKQALLFLSFLPVPNQWRWLSKAIDTFPDDPEINNFLNLERQTIQSKLSQKSQVTFKLKQFIQILKSPRLPQEKGVIRIFSHPYLFLDKQVLSKIADHYLFYIEPASGIVFRHLWYRVFTELADPCFFGLSGEEDRQFVAMQSNTQVISLAHGDFLTDVNPPADPVVKDFDIVFNGTFDDMPRKRHILMLELLKERSLLNKKALFIGRGSLENVEAFKREVDHLGLADRVTILSNVRRQDVAPYLARCKVGVHLALYENACRCIYEYFRADIPCVISSATAGVDNTLFNPETGQVGNDDQLSEIIARMLKERSSYSPRKWFLNHSGSGHSSRALNESLTNFFTGKGYLWQNDIVPLDSSGASRYIKKDHYRQFLPEYKQLLVWLKPSISPSIKLIVDEV